MSSSPALPEPANDASPTPVSQRDEDAQYYRQVLHELVEIGTRLARSHRPPGRARVHHTSPPQPPSRPASPPQPQHTSQHPSSPSPSSASRAPCAAPSRLPARSPSPPSPARPRAPQQGRSSVAPSARKQIIREVEDTIHREAHGSKAEAEALHAELYERLDTLDLDDDLDTMPIADLIAALRRDLGIAAHITSRGISPWKRRRPADVRDLCARAARPRAAQPRPEDPLPVPAPSPRTGTGPPRP